MQAFAQKIGDGLGVGFHAVDERAEVFRARFFWLSVVLLFAAEHLGEAAAHEAAVVAFQIVEHGEGSAQAEFFGIARVDAGDEGGDQVVEDFVAQTPTDERRQTFVFFGAVGGTKYFEQQSAFRLAAEEFRLNEAAGTHGDVV